MCYFLGIVLELIAANQAHCPANSSKMWQSRQCNNNTFAVLTDSGYEYVGGLCSYGFDMLWRLLRAKPVT